jgi:alkylation response protein AidB-like acyl-CoA dehydrogenase
MGDRNGSTALWPSTDELLPEHILIEIRRGAAAADESATLDASTLDLLRTAGYFGLPVPRDLNGAGASLLECAATQGRLAAADPGLAIAANMHLFSLGIAVEHWKRHHDTCGLLLEAISTQQRIVASAFAEPGLGGSVLHSTVKAARTDGGYRISGVKSPCSFATHCDLICLQMQAEAAEPNGLMVAVIPATAEGVRVERTWDSLGMRGSASDTVVLEDCFVPDGLVFHRAQPGFDADETFTAGLIWFCVTTTATYLGVAGAAVAAVCAGLQKSSLPHLNCRRADLPSVHGQLGDEIAGLLAVEAACTAVATGLDRGGSTADLLPVAIATKHRAVEVCTRAVENAAELLGGVSYARTSAVARLWRDVQAVRFHPPTRLVGRQIIGRWALGLPLSFDLCERPGINPVVSPAADGPSHAPQ